MAPLDPSLLSQGPSGLKGVIPATIAFDENESYVAPSLPNKEFLEAALTNLCKTNFLVFMRAELGMDVGRHHREWWEDLRTGEDTAEMAPRDHGKRCGNRQEVLTSIGWKTHGTLELGDEVFTPSGCPTKIVQLMNDGWCNLEVCFSNGEAVICHADHEWVVVDRARKHGSQKRGQKRKLDVRVMETSQLAAEGLAMNGKESRHRFWLPNVAALEFTQKVVIIPPYVLGVWLGDGKSSRGLILQGKDDADRLFGVLKDKWEVCWEEKDPHKTTGVRSVFSRELHNALKTEWLLNNKHIPEVYLRSSIEQRLELLAGLIDTDGCVEQVRQKGRNYSTQRVRFVNTNTELIDQIAELCLGLGFRVSKSVAPATVSSSGVHGRLPTHYVRITPTLDVPTFLPRKKISGQRSRGLPRIAIVKIRACNPERGRCIQVSAPDGMYLIGRSLIPTHNSMALARAYPIWKAKYDPWVKDTLILGPDGDSAVENLEKLKELIHQTPSLAPLIPDDRLNYFNSKTAVKLRNGSVIRAKGFFSPLRGRHPQLIILDDILNERNCATKENRALIRRRFFEVIYPMRDRGTAKMRRAGYKPQIVIVGTAQDRNDLLHELLSNAGFKGRKQRAVINDETKEVLWSERYSHEVLMKIKKIAGALSFSKEYQNEPLTEETTIFPPSLFEPLKDRTLSYVQKYEGGDPVFLGVDFSVPGATQGDWTVVWAMRFDLEDAVFVPLNYWRAQPGAIDDQIREIIRYCVDYKVTLGLLEANSFQRVYAEQFRRRSILPLKGHTVTRKGKHSATLGLLSLRPLFENGRMRLPYRTERDQAMTDELITEFNGIIKKGAEIGNFTYHDDIPMAIWHALVASRGSEFHADFGPADGESISGALPTGVPDPESLFRLTG